MQADGAVFSHNDAGGIPAYTSYGHTPSYERINSGTGTVQTVCGFYSSGGIETGWTCTNYTPIKIANPAATGTITNLIGIDIAGLNTGSTLNLSMRSLGNTTEMWHGGPIIVGASTHSPDTRLEVEESKTLSSSPLDDYAAALTLDPSYTSIGAYTVTRHNYIDVQDVGIAGGATVTDACVLSFDAGAGTHKALDTGTIKVTPGSVDAWMKINIYGTIYYIPAYTSKTA